MIDLEQLNKCNEKEWHKPYGGQITLNCEDVDILLKALDKACQELVDGEIAYVIDSTETWDKEQWEEYLLSEVSK